MQEMLLHMNGLSGYKSQIYKSHLLRQILTAEFKYYASQTKKRGKKYPKCTFCYVSIYFEVPATDMRLCRTTATPILFYFKNL